MVGLALMPESRERVVVQQQDLPVIDLSWRKERVRRLIVRACEEFGFFKLINHGVQKKVIDGIDREAREFFSLPASEKQKAGPPNPLGYGSKKIGNNGDTGELEYLLFHTNPSSISQRVRMISEEDPLSFSSVVNEYVEAVRELACELMEIIGEGLGLENTSAFSRLIRDDESDSLVRLNHYPPYLRRSAEEEEADDSTKTKEEIKNLRVGFGEHTDPQILTILRSNDVEGLQLQSPLDGRVWIPVKSDPSAFFVNVGDALQAMTNGRFLSVRHRAMANAKRSRLSTMFFAAPSLQTCIYPLPEMITAENPQRYRPYTWAEFKKIMYSLRLASNRLELFHVDRKGNYPSRSDEMI
ncbi:Gibberellin 2-beta-dioxygenase 2 [Apostasia shenzhenica]|uniref:gibberellin 2beta-dioxygenase n=1 Tax=Apostasia shenzhenica TaxID=1088818 RepID=A0A2I0AAX7_9ASPA|nr:Gibberellin 2-beta-dioxygenase 2 [Apostasia shenzhenica]